MNHKKIIKIVVIALVLVSLSAVGWYWNDLRSDKSIESTVDQSKVVISDLKEETMTSENKETQDSVQLSGSFIEIDSAHKASGKAEIIQNDGKVYIRLAEDFTVAPGPDLYLYLSSDQDFKNTTNGVDTSKTLNVGKLKSLAGEQVYEITPEQFESYNSAIVIWCKAFGVQFSRADLAKV